MAKNTREAVDHFLEGLSGGGLIISMVVMWMSPPPELKYRLIMMAVMLVYVVADWWVSRDEEPGPAMRGYNLAHAIPMLTLALLIENGARYTYVTIALAFVFLVGSCGHAFEVWRFRKWMFAVNLISLALTAAAYTFFHGDFRPLIGTMMFAASFSMLANRWVVAPRAA